MLKLGETIYIQQIMRKEHVNPLHSEQNKFKQMMENTKSSKIWWPSINCDMNKKLEKCDLCIKNQPKKNSSPLILIEKGDRPAPAAKVTSDFFKIQKHIFST